MDCAEKIEIQLAKNPGIAVAYCVLKPGHVGKHELAPHIAQMYRVDRYGNLPEVKHG